MGRAVFFKNKIAAEASLRAAIPPRKVSVSPRRSLACTILSAKSRRSRDSSVSDKACEATANMIRTPVMPEKKNSYRLNSSGKETGRGTKTNLENGEEPKGTER
jgi:hypothetical protein